jgi:hypothetical protein
MHGILKFDFGYQTMNDFYADWILENFKLWDKGGLPIALNNMSLPVTKVTSFDFESGVIL